MSATRSLSVLLILGMSYGCGNSAADSSGVVGSPLDLSGDANLNFYTATGSFVSASFYNLDIDSGKVKRYSASADNSLTVDAERTMTTDNQSSVASKLKALYATSFGQCTAAVCNTSRSQYWVGVMDNNPPAYYFAYEGDCSCPSDGENKAVIRYDALKALYNEVKGSL